MVPDYQTLMRPVLAASVNGEVRIADVVKQLAEKFDLSEEERSEVLPSGKQTRFSNRANWAKSYLKQAGLVKVTGRGRYVITKRGKSALDDKGAKINRNYLEQFEEYQSFRARSKNNDPITQSASSELDFSGSTPDEMLRAAHKQINVSIAEDLIDRVRIASPAFFESLIVDLLVAMGYGGTSEDPGRTLGQTGDGGVDGVIDQDPLGVDQIYIQAKRYKDSNTIGAGAIRDFFGALNLKRAQKGIFVTTSSFSNAAVKTADDLGSRIVLLDGGDLARLMMSYNVGCRDEQILHLKKIDDEFFE